MRLFPPPACTVNGNPLLLWEIQLVSFINSLLHGREQIKELTYLNTEHLGTGESDRRAVFDVYCENEYGEKFLVEMQRGEQQFFKDRSLYYATFPIREQARRGDWDYELQRVYVIGILNFSFDGTRPDKYWRCPSSTSPPRSLTACSRNGSSC